MRRILDLMRRRRAGARSRRRPVESEPVVTAKAVSEALESGADVAESVSAASDAAETESSEATF